MMKRLGELLSAVKFASEVRSVANGKKTESLPSQFASTSGRQIHLAHAVVPSDWACQYFSTCSGLGKWRRLSTEFLLDFLKDFGQRLPLRSLLSFHREGECAELAQCLVQFGRFLFRIRHQP
jgi:hypothetical protein